MHLTIFPPPYCLPFHGRVRTRVLYDDKRLRAVSGGIRTGIAVTDNRLPERRRPTSPITTYKLMLVILIALRFMNF